MADPLQPINEAKATVAARAQRRAQAPTDMRGAAAAETIADELTMIRAEMSVMRGLLAMIAAKR
jgi:hypothetical protein